MTTDHLVSNTDASPSGGSPTEQLADSLDRRGAVRIDFLFQYTRSPDTPTPCRQNDITKKIMVQIDRISAINVPDMIDGFQTEFKH